MTIDQSRDRSGDRCMACDYPLGEIARPTCPACPECGRPIINDADHAEAVLAMHQGMTMLGATVLSSIVVMWFWSMAAVVIMLVGLAASMGWRGVAVLRRSMPGLDRMMAASLVVLFAPLLVLWMTWRSSIDGGVQGSMARGLHLGLAASCIAAVMWAAVPFAVVMGSLAKARGMQGTVHRCRIARSAGAIGVIVSCISVAVAIIAGATGVLRLVGGGAEFYRVAAGSVGVGVIVQFFHLWPAANELIGRD
ncbi:MAG: hypothetical protein AB8G96_15445 [Phycisphaerales bacterium]